MAGEPAGPGAADEPATEGSRGAADQTTLDATQVSPTPVGARSKAPSPAPLIARPAHPLHRVVLVLALVVAVFLAHFCAHFVFAAVPRASTMLAPVTPAATAASGLLGDLAAALASNRVAHVRALLESVVYSVGGVLLARRRRDDAMLQLVVAGILLMGVNSATVATLTTVPSDSPAAVWRVIALVLYTLAPVTSLGVFAVYPSGRPVPPWALGYAAVGSLPFVIFSGIMYARHRFESPVLFVGMAAALGMLGAQRHRYRKHATVRQQHQIKWLAYGGLLFLLLEVGTLAALSPMLDPARRDYPFWKLLHEALLFGAYMVPFASMAISAAEYRLWEVDRVINRSLVYAMLTALLALAFVVAFFGLRALFVGLFPGSGVLGAVAGAILVGGLFAPVRRALGRWVDRRFFGIMVDYDELARRATEVGSLPIEGSTFASFASLTLLGRGGMGAVYKASHPDYGFAVVLKVMSPEVAARPEARARFDVEAAVLEKMDHPHIVPYLTRGETYLVMTHVEGRDLASRIAEGPMSLEEALPILRDVGSALDAIHARGIVHRDVKPANILLARSGAMLMDFGVARMLDAPGDDDNVVGTLAFMAPEQIHAPREVDGRADLYALGVTAYEMLTGQLPFSTGEPLSLALLQLRAAPPDPRTHVPEMPVHVAFALLQALEKRPEDRPVSGAAFVRALAGPNAD